MGTWKRGACAVLGALLLAPGAWAGWEIEQVNYSLRPDGTPVTKRNSTLRVSKGRVRVVDGATVIVIDYAGDRLTLMVPPKQVYWSGTADEYLREVARLDWRKRQLPEKAATPAGGQAKASKPIDIKIIKSGETATIAGRSAVKYDITADGAPVQQLWVAGDLNLGGDLDVQRLQAFQEKIGQSVRGKRGATYSALARHAEYARLHKTGFPMKTQLYLGKAVLGREVVRVARVDVADHEFTVPEGYTRLSLDSYLEAQDAVSQ